MTVVSPYSHDRHTDTKNKETPGDFGMIFVISLKIMEGKRTFMTVFIKKRRTFMTVYKRTFMTVFAYIHDSRFPI